MVQIKSPLGVKEVTLIPTWDHCILRARFKYLHKNCKQKPEGNITVDLSLINMSEPEILRL